MNVGLIVLDSVRKDIFEQYAPRLRELADVVVPECRAASSWSVPSHAALVTGQLPSTVGVHSYQKSYSHVPVEQTVFDTDHRRVGVSSNLYANVHYGFDRFFDEFANLHTRHPAPDGLRVGRALGQREGRLRRLVGFLREAVEHDHTVQTLRNGLTITVDDLSDRLPIPRLTDEGTNAITRQLRDATSDEPWFLFANCMEAHSPHRPTVQYDSTLYDAPTTWTSYDVNQWAITRRLLAGESLTDEQRRDLTYFRQLYTAAVEYLDRQLSTLIERVRAECGETMFIVTADHGENIAFADDERICGHTSSMSEGLLRVPFLVIGGPAWLRENPPELFSHLDLRALIENVRTDERRWPTRDRVPAELVGGGENLPPDNHDFFDRAIRVVYDDPETKWEWDSLGNRNREPWDESVHDLFSEPIDEMKRRAAADSSETAVADHVESRLEDLGYR